MSKITRQELHPDLRNELDSVRDYIQGSINEAVGAHLADLNNPHQVTKAQVGLGNVANVLQASKAEFDAHAQALNPHGITTDRIGAVPTGRTVSTGTGLTGGGSLSANRTISFSTTWGDDRYLPRRGGYLDGEIRGGSISSKLTHRNGYFDIEPYNASYDDGSVARLYWDGFGSNLNVYKANGSGDVDINVSGGRVHTTKSIRYGTANPSGGRDGDIYIQI